jgi:hypothetical protein
VILVIEFPNENWLLCTKKLCTALSEPAGRNEKPILPSVSHKAGFFQKG